jgi:DNA-binding transcriptional ArsR family regulator
MTDDETPDVQAVAEALADPDCRRIVAALESPLTAREVADCCDLSRTTAYRKLDALRSAELVEERIQVRDDGTHPRQYVRDVAGVVVAYSEPDDFDVEVVPAPPPDADSSAAADGDGTSPADAGPDADGESPDERLARYWAAVSEEL